MKIIGTIICLLVVSMAAMAQPQRKLPDIRLKVPDTPPKEFNLFDTIPSVKLPGHDGLVFTDSIGGSQIPAPGYYGQEFDLLANDLMPVVTPGAGFYSNMPVAVPDSSVHYHILQKRLNMQGFAGDRDR